MKARISKRTTEAMKPGAFISDTDLPGFMARCLPSGVITYGDQYRANGKRRAHGAHAAPTCPASAFAPQIRLPRKGPHLRKPCRRSSLRQADR